MKTQSSPSPNAVASRKFPTGRIIATPGALNLLEGTYAHHSAEAASNLLRRHAAGDWGDLCEEDKSENERALRTDQRVLSAYKLPVGAEIWIVTEWNRTVTTLLLPEEY